MLPSYCGCIVHSQSDIHSDLGLNDFLIHIPLLHSESSNDWGQLRDAGSSSRLILMNTTDGLGALDVFNLGFILTPSPRYSSYLDGRSQGQFVPPKGPRMMKNSSTSTLEAPFSADGPRDHSRRLDKWSSAMDVAPQDCLMQADFQVREATACTIQSAMSADELFSGQSSAVGQYSQETLNRWVVQSTHHLRIQIGLTSKWPFVVD